MRSIPRETNPADSNHIVCHSETVHRLSDRYTAGGDFTKAGVPALAPGQSLGSGPAGSEATQAYREAGEHLMRNHDAIAGLLTEHGYRLRRAATFMDDAADAATRRASGF